MTTERQRQQADSTLATLMELIDCANEGGTFVASPSSTADGFVANEEDYLADSGYARVTDLRLRQAHVAALAAIALLLLRRDDEAWSAWLAY